MGQRVSDTVTIQATPTEIMDVIVALEDYPNWADGVKAVEVIESDGEGRPVLATFTVDAQVQVVHYTLRYTHDGNVLTWVLEQGDVLTQLDGVYDLTAADGATRVRYELEVDISLPIPGFLKKRAAKRILDTGLQGLKRRVELG